MKNFWQILYNTIAVPFMKVGFSILSFFNAKVKIGKKGRKRLFEDLILNLADINRQKKLVWFHSSSLGEFEQAKPIIEKLKKEKDVNILTTFFSPSGYKNSLHYPYADVISYLPLDSSINVERFINLVKPSLVVLMRYDIWPNMIWKLGKKKIPVFIADATLRSNSKRLLPVISNFHVSLFKNISRILTVSQVDYDNYSKLVPDKSKLIAVGDTRFDRVFQKSEEAKNKTLINPKIIENKKVLVLGSSWEADEDILLPAITKLFHYDKDILVIIAPHEPTILRLEQIEEHFFNKYETIRFSLLNNYKNERVILIDSIGILLSLYKYADAAYVGGSFKQGIHNVLEPAVYGIPVLFGPKIENSQEALELVHAGSGIIIKNKKEAYRQLRNLFINNEYRRKLGNISAKYVSENLGASDKIIHEIEAKL
ncbi:3-deoxy-D-manno-octulosonic acid transferase [bacterium BMS3Abin04]|nr:3-deoxy-D-manno-octulosonic acid transferase [bacterium BMS3Abin04]